MRGARGVDRLQALGHMLIVDLGHREMQEPALNTASCLKQTSLFQKMRIDKINEADYCQLLRGT